MLIGSKGSGKTKQMIDMVNGTVERTDGAVVCLEHGKSLTFDVAYGARLIDTSPYDIRSYQVLRGFITGLYAGNYDIGDIFIDSLLKVAGNSDMEECGKFLSWCERFGETYGISFTVSISAPAESAAESVRKYIS
ncbi:MAG: hypothetical protein LBI44_02770 [Oscillospiraceae bacterium]|nr:hypothetical protein [Oscillospiraceae bacterium]